MWYTRRIVYAAATCLALFLSVMAWRGGVFADWGLKLRSRKKISDPAELRLRVDFNSTLPDKRMSVILPAGYAFVPKPGTEVRVTALWGSPPEPLDEGTFSLGLGNPVEGGGFRFVAPREAGAVPVVFTYPGLRPVRLVCLVPFEDDSADGKVDGLSIGRPPDPARGPKGVRKHASAYQPPRWFVRITEDVEHLRLSPVVKVGDLVCPTGRDEPYRHVSFAPVNYDLIRFVTAGWRVFSRSHPGIPRWRYISWYRTPAHNRREGGSRYSRHMYGDACDIIVDLDGDWRMDDLTGDGRIDRKDAITLARAFEEISRSASLQGGIGVYEYPGPTSAGAAVHVDLRGYRERWGYSWMSGRKRSFVWYERVEE